MVPLVILVGMTLAALSVLHVYWAVGGRWGHATAIPQRDGHPAFQPGSAPTLLIAGLLAAAGMVMLGRVGLGPVARLSRLTHIGAWLVAVAFLLRGLGDFRLVGLFRRVNDTRFAWWDRRVYTPVALGLGIAAGIIAASTAQPAHAADKRLRAKLSQE
jgi:hypothetical protein